MSIILPSSPTVPTPGLASKASTTRRAWATEASEGAKARLIGATCAGWMASRPRKPSVAASSEAASSPASSRKSAWSVSMGATPAAFAASSRFARAMR